MTTCAPFIGVRCIRRREPYDGSGVDDTFSIYDICSTYSTSCDESMRR